MDNNTDSLRKRKRMEEASFWFGYDPSEAEEEARRQGCQPFYEDVVGVPVTESQTSSRTTSRQTCAAPRVSPWLPRASLQGSLVCGAGRALSLQAGATLL